MSRRRTAHPRNGETFAEDSRLIVQIETELGWKLAPEQRAEALERAADGASAATLADWYQRLETARTELNDPQVGKRESPPARAEGSDPRRSGPSDRKLHYKP